MQDIQLPDEDTEIEPVSTSGGGQKPETEMERLSNIIREFNDRFGNIDWKDQDKIEKVIAEESCPRRLPATEPTRMQWPTPTSRTRESSTTRPWNAP